MFSKMVNAYSTKIARGGSLDLETERYDRKSRYSERYPSNVILRQTIIRKNLLILTKEECKIPTIGTIPWLVKREVNDSKEKHVDRSRRMIVATPGIRGFVA